MPHSQAIEEVTEADSSRSRCAAEVSFYWLHMQRTYGGRLVRLSFPFLDPAERCESSTFPEFEQTTASCVRDTVTKELPPGSGKNKCKEKIARPNCQYSQC